MYYFIILLFIVLILILSFIICLSNSGVISGGGGKLLTHKKNNKLTHKKNNKLMHKKSISLANDLIISDSIPKSKIYLTYTISGEDNGLDYSQLRLLLKNASTLGFCFIEKPVTEKVHLSFGTFKNDAVVNGEVKRWNFDPLFFKQSSAIKNTLGAHTNIINKSKLYHTIKALLPNALKYLPKSYTIKEFEEMLNNKELFKIPYILKKDNVPQQAAVQIILSKDEYFSAKTKFNIKEDAVVSEYISNPLLLDGKKFHLRIHFLLSIISGIIRCTVHQEYKIRTAKDHYKHSDWENTDIHLSGGHNTTQIYKWPDDIQKEYPNDFKRIQKNLDECNTKICKLMTIAGIKNYSESYAGFHLYGADIMITDDYKIYFIEINNKPGFGEYISNVEAFMKTLSHNIFSFILDNAVFPFFGIKRPCIGNTSFAEHIGKGALTQFAKILNIYMLIPYLDATEQELKIANTIHMFPSLSINCEYINIFIIKALPKVLIKSNSDGNIIGYLALTKTNYLTAAIIQEYQHRGIATAMIAQFMEIHYVRNYLHKEHIYINKSNIFMEKIAKKLHLKHN